MSFPVFASGDVLNASDMNAVGLWLVKTQAIGSTPVSAVAVTSAFSADYDSYKIVVTGVQNSSTAADIAFQLSGSTVGYYGSFQYVNYTTNGGANASNTNSASWSWCGSATNIGGWLGGMVCDVINPFQTGFTSIVAGPTIYNNLNGTYTGINDANASHTGFTISAGSGQLVNGTIRVYGYKK